MPSDITGHAVLDPRRRQRSSARARRGPVFTNLLLADEINRAPAKTQAALLEVMQEYQVTLEGETHALGSRSWCWRRRTRSRPKAPTRCPRRSSTASCSRSRSAIRRTRDESWRSSAHDGAAARRAAAARRRVAGASTRRGARAAGAARAVASTSVSSTTRCASSARRASGPAWPRRGPRGAIALVRAARAAALLAGRDFVTPDDVKRYALPALRHRVCSRPTRSSRAGADELLARLLVDSVEAPRL